MSEQVATPVAVSPWSEAMLVETVRLNEHDPDWDEAEMSEPGLREVTVAGTVTQLGKVCESE